MTTQNNVSKALALVDKFVQATVELVSGNWIVATPLATREVALVKAQDDLENYLVSFVVPRSRKRTAYVCCGCGGIYWKNHINCDCNIPYMKEYKMAKVTVIAPKPFNEIVKKAKQK